MNRYVLEVTHPLDNIAIAIEDIPAGSHIEVLQRGLTSDLRAMDDIPFGQHVAIKAIARGKVAIRGGLRVGVAAQDILPGQHVNAHNLTGAD